MGHRTGLLTDRGIGHGAAERNRGRAPGLGWSRVIKALSLGMALSRRGHGQADGLTNQHQAAK